jgi:UDP-3-O-[3-hydroxymyristoyl] glucosamine N-acyltransferase
MVSTGGYLEIGDYCLFGPRVSIVDADHGFSDITRPYAEQTPTMGRSIIVEENCWIAAGAVVAGHLTVGRGSVIGANAVVTKDVPPFSVVVGHPGQIVKMYDPSTGRWEPARTEADQRRILENRARVPLPDRVQYRALLRQNSRSTEVPPIVAGRGECL